MALPLPHSLSPSKVSSFKSCALAFRFAAIDRLPEPPSPHTLKGTLVHRVLERLFWNHPRGSRTREAAEVELDTAWRELLDDPELHALDLAPADLDAFRQDAATLVSNAFVLEDPDSVEVVGVELTLETRLGGLLLRGIIDRLDVETDGSLTVVDYKTGRVPHERRERDSLAGVHFYALLCEEVLGRRPARVRLDYLRAPISIEAVPTDQTLRGLRQRTGAVWSAIERACDTEDFRPNPSPLCNWCAFQAHCPAFGGNPQDAGELANSVCA